MSATKNAEKIAGSAFGVSLTIMFSRVLGLVRDVALVFFFGATTWILDAFYFAFTIPNLLRNLLGEGALTAAFVPAFVRERAQAVENSPVHNRASALASSVLTLLFIVTGALTLGGAAIALGASEIISGDEKIKLTLVLLAIMLPFATLICLSAIMGAILQTLRVFILPALMSCGLNLLMLAAMLIYGFREFPTEITNLAQLKNIFTAELSLPQLIVMIKAVGWSVVIAGGVQIVVQYLALAARGVRIFPRFNFSDDALKKVIANFLPAAAGLGVVQVNTLLDNLLAYGLSLGYFGTVCAGATTYLFLGNRLMQLPLGVFTIALATTAFPTFAALAANKKHQDLTITLFSSLRNLWFIMLPAAAGLMVLAWTIIVMLYQNPDMQFSEVAVFRTTLVLIILAAALPLFSAIHLFTRTFYALDDYRTPVKIALQTVGLNFVGNLILMRAPLPEFIPDFAGINPASLPNLSLNEAGLALSTTLCAGINALRLWRALGRRLPENWLPATRAFLNNAGAQLLSVAGMAVGTYLVLRSMPYGPELIYRLERGLVGVAAGVIVYSIFASTFCNDDYEHFMRRWRRKPRAE